MIECITVPAHEETVQVPRTYVITLTEAEATDLTSDLIRYKETYCPRLATIQIFDFLKNRNHE